jgi:Co/Zn/Cd efflux system component
MEERILEWTTWLHMASGTIALVVAPLAMAVAKGSDAHRRWGGLFLRSLVVVVVTSLFLGVMRLDWLMVMLAVLAMHMAASGYRSLYHKKLHEGQKPARNDVWVQGVAATVHGGFFLWGAIHLFFGHDDGNALLFLLSGALGLVLVWLNTFRFYKRNHDKNEWLYGHMSGFIGGYLVLLAGFSAVYLQAVEPLWLRLGWLAMLGVPLLVGWTRYLKGRFTKGRRAKHVYPVRFK